MSRVSVVSFPAWTLIAVVTRNVGKIYAERRPGQERAACFCSNTLHSAGNSIRFERQLPRLSRKNAPGEGGKG